MLIKSIKERFSLAWLLNIILWTATLTGTKLFFGSVHSCQSTTVYICSMSNWAILQLLLDLAIVWKIICFSCDNYKRYINNIIFKIIRFCRISDRQAYELKTKNNTIIHIKDTFKNQLNEFRNWGWNQGMGWTARFFLWRYFYFSKQRKALIILW